MNAIVSLNEIKVPDAGGRLGMICWGKVGMLGECLRGETFVGYGGKGGYLLIHREKRGLYLARGRSE
jgi:hypothetical protein|nr:hypothetical protein Q903MT_gene6317 [Picea sitchensis]